ncbi:hypothetical protein DLREEDagrD3_27980 [Denitratisoma sp. agr-D3]
MLALLALVEANRAHDRTHAQLVRQVGELECLIDGEHRLVRQMLDQFINGERPVDRAVRYWSRSSDVLGSDFLLVARTPAQGLHVMYVDDMRRNTLAAVSAFPVIAPFYRMTEKGYGIDAILREANARLFRFYPDGHPLSVSMVSVDFNDGVIQVWNSGASVPILIAPQGGVSFPTKVHPGLGVVAPEQFVVEAEVWTSLGVEYLALGSRALLHQIGAGSAEDFLGWLRQQGYPEFSAWAGTGFPPSSAIQGDASLLLVDCRKHAAPLQERVVAQRGSTDGGEWSLNLSIGPEEMRTVDVVPLLLGGVGQFVSTRAMGGVLFVILSELYNNALDHGVLGMDSTLKLGPDGMGIFLEERSRRLSALGHGRIDLSLSQTMGPDGPLLTITCTDSGPGFDHGRLNLVQATEDNPLPYGRGLALVASLTTGMEFNREGNQIRVRLPVMMDDLSGSKLSS